MPRHAAFMLPSSNSSKKLPVPIPVDLKVSRHAACMLPSSDHLKKLPVSIPVDLKMSRHAACMLPSRDHPKKLPVVTTVSGIMVQVQKVTTQVSQLEKIVEVESSCRREMKTCMDQLILKMETAEAKQSRNTQEVKNGRHRGADAMQHFRRELPCKSLEQLDLLLSYIEHRSLQWIEYIKLLGGGDFNAAIKVVINNTMDRSVQKQLSWTGLNSKKPSLQKKYKLIVDGIHLAMKQSFKDYSIVQGEAKIHSLLRNASKCKNV